MKLHRFLTLLIYIFLLAGCIGIVCIVSKLAGPELPIVVEETMETEETEKATPSDAGEETEEETSEATPSDGAEVPEWQETVPARENEWWRAEKAEPETVVEEPEGPPEIIFASDLHLLADSLFDDGEAFQKRVAADDGKIIPYVSPVIEAFLDEVIEAEPSALVLGGDLTFYGEKESHLQLAEKLKRVEEAGIDVVLIPGNHDINTKNAKSYLGKKTEDAEDTGPEEFVEIYKDYGYEEALLRDENSLSYIWELDDKNWLMMLDSCQYEPKNLVTGRIKPETLLWMQEQLEAAKEQGIQVIPAAHHNILDQSRLYTTECKMDDNLDVVDLLEANEVPVFLSGHMHLQRIKKHKPEPGADDGAYGISEIINTSFAMPPCQYGVMKWAEDGSLSYHVKTVDVEAWARRQEGEVDENLLHFNEYSRSFLKEVMAGKVNRELENLPDEHRDAMTELYAQIYYDYCRGEAVDGKEVRKSRAYQLWERNRPDHRYRTDMDDMLGDMTKKNFVWESETE